MTAKCLIGKAQNSPPNCAALKTDHYLLLLKANMGAGHGGASGRYDYLRDLAFDYAFLLNEMGLAGTPFDKGSN